MYQSPIAYKARKAVTFRGIAYAKGQLVPADVVRTLRVGPLISRGILVVHPDPHARKAHDGPDPMVTYVPGKAYPIPSASKTTGTLTATVAVLRVTFDTDFDGPVFFDFGDGAVASQQDGHTIHYYAGPGTYATTAESATHKAAKSVVVTGAAATEAESESSEVPQASEGFSDYPVDGTIPDVKAWVGDDAVRAEYAMEQENLRDTPRVTLLDYLTTVGA